MKKFYILAAALTLTAITANAQDNLILNGNFENWTTENPENFDKVTATTGTPPPVYNDLITKETTNSKSGNAVKQESKATGSTQYLEYGDLIPVVAGRKYKISYWYQDNDSKARTRCWSSWIGNDGKALAADLQTGIQEDNNSYSVDGANWVNKIIEVVAPAGAEKIRYQARTYHQNNIGGGFIYFDDLSFTDVTSAGLDEQTIAGLQIFPNPLSGSVLNIVTSSDNSDKTVAVFDMLGKQVLNTKVVNGTVDASGLSTGIYVVKITEEGKTATKKLVVK